ncbi:MAG TPA: ABC transporter permease [Stellaceae bacterium]|nr:ABC transporter permease [Stellaceae bacterium]
MSSVQTPGVQTPGVPIPDVPVSRGARPIRLTSPRRALRALLPALSLVLVLAAIGWMNPRAISYLGFNLMLNLAIPIALATIAQMFIITVNDLDLSIGFFVSFVGCVTATWLVEKPLLGVLVLLGGIAIYALLGVLIHLRDLPSIVVTLGMSFVWQGAAILLLPQPGGKAPAWLHAIMTYHVPYVPFPIVAAISIAAVAHFGLMRTSYGAILRGAGGNPRSIWRAGWSLLTMKVVAFSLAGLFGVLSGLALTGLSTAADANIGNGYTLLSISGVILGGGEFVGGRVSPIGAVIGALTLALASSSLLSFMHVPSDWQVGANGAILIVILAARALISRGEE